MEDFADYEAATSAAGPQTIKMEPGVNMVVTEDEVSRYALKRLSDSNERPYLADFKSIRFQRGSEEVFTKTSLREENWLAFTVMKTSFDVREPPTLKCPTATVGMERIDGIITKLVPHLVPHKRSFWVALCTSLVQGRSKYGRGSQSCATARQAKKRRVQ